MANSDAKKTGPRGRPPGGPAQHAPLRPSILWGTFEVDIVAIQKALLSKGWNQKDWAAAANVSWMTASRFLKGAPSIKARSAHALITALGLSTDDVIRVRSTDRLIARSA